MMVAYVKYLEYLSGREKPLSLDTVIAGETLDEIQEEMRLRFHTRFKRFERIFQSGVIKDMETHKRWNIDSYGREVRT